MSLICSRLWFCDILMVFTLIIDLSSLGIVAAKLYDMKP